MILIKLKKSKIYKFKRVFLKITYSIFLIKRKHNNSKTTKNPLLFYLKLQIKVTKIRKLMSKVIIIIT